MRTKGKIDLDLAIETCLQVLEFLSFLAFRGSLNFVSARNLRSWVEMKIFTHA